MSTRVSIITVTLNRPSLAAACVSVDRQGFSAWHHYVLGDGVAPIDNRHAQRTTFGFSRALGAEEPGLNMPNGTPNPLQRWALRHLDLAEFVCFLDDDNVYEADFLAAMVAALDADRGVGIALCRVEDLRYGQTIDGYPVLGRCDNSGFMARSAVAKQLAFPAARCDKEVKQDQEYIRALADRFGWTRVSRSLVRFGDAPDPPPARGAILLITSWQRPLDASKRLRAGDLRGAIAELEMIVADDPCDAWALWQLAEALLLDGRHGEAGGAWRRWLDLAARGKSEHDWIALSRAVAKFAIGCSDWPEDLAEAFTLVERRMTGDGEPHLCRGLYRLVRGDGASALADLARGRSLATRIGDEDDVAWMLDLLIRLKLPIDALCDARLLFDAPATTDADVGLRLFLSPHFDDVVGSCGGVIARLADAGRETHVLTVFGGAERRPLSLAAIELHAEWMIDPVVDARRSEDGAALSILGSSGSSLDFVEALYRQRIDGTHVYPTLECLFGAPAAEDRGLAAAVADAVAERFAVDRTMIVAPLGMGAHVDHVVVHHAARLLVSRGYRAVFYRDFSYETTEAGPGRDLELAMRQIPLSEREFERKLRALASYRSQIGSLFGDVDGMRRHMEEMQRIEVMAAFAGNLTDDIQALLD